MSLTTVCQILLGSLLVVVGMIGSAIADRIRGIVRGRIPALAGAQTVPSLPPRAPRTSSQRPFVSGSLIAAAPPFAAAPNPAPVPLPQPKKKAPGPDEIMLDDVLAALVSAGYTKRIAETAVNACVGDERATTETWVKAALRRVNSRVSA